MIQTFTLNTLPKVLFGIDTISQLPEFFSAKDNVLLLTGRKSFLGSKTGSDLIYALDFKKTRYNLVQIDQEPTIELIDRIVEKYRHDKITMVVSIGGGSVIDAGKAVSAMLFTEGSIIKYLETVGTDRHPGTKVPFIAIPTTAGTGSEATKNAVISKIGDGGFKSSLRHDNFTPDVALIDPLLSLSCSATITSYSGMDAFTQLVESYLSGKSSIMIDSLIIEAIRCIRKALIPLVTDDLTNIEHRSMLSYAAFISGIALANSGLGTIHGFASSIGGYRDIPHGAICANLMAAVNRTNVKYLLKKKNSQEMLKRYTTLGKLFIAEQEHNDKYYIQAFPEILEDMTEQLNIPKLGKLGLKKEDVAIISEKTSNKNNPVQLNQEDLERILLSRL
jgi:alcohol dehydrogenase class IV